MGLSLDSTWSFHPIFHSILTLDIFTPPTSIGINRDLIISFSNGNESYITTILYMDGINDHQIHPGCYNNLSVASGDIYDLLSSDNGRENRAEKAGARLSTSFQPESETPIISYPWTFTLTYDPSDGLLTISLSNPDVTARSCKYSGWNIDSNTDVYFAVMYQNQIFEMGVCSRNTKSFMTLGPDFSPHLNQRIHLMVKNCLSLMKNILGHFLCGFALGCKKNNDIKSK